MDNLSNYRILQNLGQGSYASVLLAQRKQDGKLYAIKRISFIDSNEKSKKGSLNEIRLLASLQSEYIVAFKSAFFQQEDHCLYMVMEYAGKSLSEIEGGDLARIIEDHKQKKQRFREEDIWKVLYDLSKALKTLHQNNIVHRDLKPANIILGSNNKYKLADLNISRKVKHGELLQTIIGTPFYLSPEIWKNETYDLKTDMWSLGIIAYEMATLELPFPASTMEELKRKVVKSGKYKRIPTYYSEQLCKLITKLMTPKANERPTPNDVIATCLFSTFKLTNKPPHIPINNELLQTLKWPDQGTNMVDLIPQSQYEEESIVRPRVQLLRTSARSFRLRTNTFVGKPQQSPKNFPSAQKPSNLPVARRISMLQKGFYDVTMLDDITRRTNNECPLLEVSARQIVLKPLPHPKTGSVNRNY